MAMRPIPENRIAAAQAALREKLKHDRQSTPDPINLDNTLALGQPIPLLWRGTEFHVALITVPQALNLQSVDVAWKNPGPAPTSEEQVEVVRKLYYRTVELFWSLLSPRPAANPFVDLLPQEVGELIGFFFVCQTMQSRSRSPVGGRN